MPLNNFLTYFTLGIKLFISWSKIKPRYRQNSFKRIFISDELLLQV